MALIFPALVASVTMFTKAMETCFHQTEARHVHQEEDEDKRARGKGFKRQEWKIEGAKTTVGIDAMIKSTLHPGAKSGDDLLAKIGENHSPHLQ